MRVQGWHMSMSSLSPALMDDLVTGWSGRLVKVSDSVG